MITTYDHFAVGEQGMIRRVAMRKQRDGEDGNINHVWQLDADGRVRRRSPPCGRSATQRNGVWIPLRKCVCQP